MTGRDAARSSGRVAIEDATVVAPEAVFQGSVLVEGEEIAAVVPDGAVADRVDERIDAGGNYLLPGLVDVHGDDVEQQLFPRGSEMDPEIALDAVDRTNLSAGITTKCHAIAYQEAAGEHRSPAVARRTADAIAAAGHLRGDHRVHARIEVTHDDCVEFATAALRRDRVAMVSLMAHRPADGQLAGTEALRESLPWEFEDEAQFRQWLPATTVPVPLDDRIEDRTGLDRSELDRRVAAIVGLADEAGVPVASHDDESPGGVEYVHDCGIAVSEFPTTLQAARRAHELGVTTAMSAPNLLRGGSQYGNLSTARAIEAGVVDVLCTDYHPHSLLPSVFVPTGEPLHRRVARATARPAAALGMPDRGRIEAGARADLLLVERDPVPRVERALVAGDPVYRAG